MLGGLLQGQGRDVRVLPQLGEFAVQALEEQGGQLVHLGSEVTGQLTKERIDIGSHSANVRESHGVRSSDNCGSL
ncbi:hypothetical protein GCM10010275_18710 [Streptomyces litmocidini]|nr:hypothetical protein GCM10010275_18710 [Streptomyces litmocidini]